MRFVSIDVETTGFDPVENQVIEFAAVIEDTSLERDVDDLPFFHCYVVHDEYNWLRDASNFDGNSKSDSTFEMNKDIFEKIKNREDYPNDLFLNSDEVVDGFVSFLEDNGFSRSDDGVFELVGAGKNIMVFDKPFLNELSGWSDNIRLRHRSIDPTVLYIRWDEDDVPPSFQECLDRAGFDKTVSHNALDDARDVIKLVRKKI